MGTRAQTPPSAALRLLELQVSRHIRSAATPQQPDGLPVPLRLRRGACARTEGPGIARAGINIAGATCGTTGAWGAG